jgi:predicted nucleotidyltransferase component of viral defense system
MENTIDLNQLIRKVTVETKFVPEMLEKDYHLTKILHKISEKHMKDVVFKGGTCLNKCYLGFYRLSEDLDFIYNKDIRKYSKTQVKKILDELRREFFDILDTLGFKTNKKLGEGWQMLTSEIAPKIVGLIINTYYTSSVTNTPQKIKIEISFRRKLRRTTKNKVINHKFIDVLGEPVLRKDIKIEAIDLVENFAEKFKALITRKHIAVRDIYDIHFILRNEILAIDKEIIDLIIIKINESKKFTKRELVRFIKDLSSKVSDLDEKQIKSVIKSDENIDIKKMTNLIVKKFAKY